MKYHQRTPFCKVCYDSGKPYHLYSSHYVKDKPGSSGVVVCPTLLKIVCQNCGCRGHTTRYCPQTESLFPNYYPLLDIFEDDDFDLFPEYNC